MFTVERISLTNSQARKPYRSSQLEGRYLNLCESDMSRTSTYTALRKTKKPASFDLQDAFLHNQPADLFGSLGEVGLYVTDGRANTIGVNKIYEDLTGIEVEKVLGRNMREIEDSGLIDRSVTLLSLKHNASVTIDQTTVFGKRTIITSTPVFNQAGKIILVTSLLYPWGYKEFSSATIGEPPNPTSYTQLNDFVFVSQKMHEITERAMRSANSDYTVLVTGESGVGKEVIARLVHQLSSRKDKPFIKVNVPSIPKELFESELFGYREGAFTGALKSGKTGLVQIAAGGTLFLDEIGEIPPSAQVKLLRLIQEKEVLPVGSVEARQIDVRFIAATNRDLMSMVQSGDFREDLFYRLSVIPIHIPPLRERQEDIQALLDYFIQEQCSYFKTRKFVTPAAFQTLLDYSWPGNVREMQNLMTRLFVIHTQPEITESMVYDELFSDNYHSGSQLQPLLTSGLQETMENYERRLIEGALHRCNGNVEKTARILGIHRTTLLRKLQKYHRNKRLK